MDGGSARSAAVEVAISRMAVDGAVWVLCARARGAAMAIMARARPGSADGACRELELGGRGGAVKSEDASFGAPDLLV